MRRSTITISHHTNTKEQRAPPPHVTTGSADEQSTGSRGMPTLAGAGNALHTCTMAQKLKGQPGLEDELDPRLGKTWTLLSKRAGGSYGLAGGSGDGTSAKPHLITSSVKRTHS